MGQQALAPLRSHTVVRKQGKVVLELSSPPEYLEFESSKSFMLSYGIDRQTNEKFRRKSLSSIAGAGAEKMTSMFRKTVGLPHENTLSFMASTATAECTFDGMKKQFLLFANKVDTNGIFIFHFTGHGLLIGKTEWGLAPADFDYTNKTFITGTVLADWLQQTTFQGRYALFILDTCYSGGIGNEIVLNSAINTSAAGIYVLTACTANESSMIVSALGQSVFSYFLMTSVFNSYSQPGKIYIKELYEDCNACCMAFSALLLSYDAEHRTLKWSMMQPELKQYSLPDYLQSLYDEEPLEETDSGAVAAGRFEFILKLYDYDRRMKKNSVPEKSLAWLNTVSDPNEGPLHELKKRDVLWGRILTAAIASMMYSIASVFLACEDRELKINDPNIFIISLLHVVAAIDKVHQDVLLSLEDVRTALDYYIHALNKHKVSVKMLQKLKSKIMQQEGEESTDSCEVDESAASNNSASEVEVYIPPLCQWVPLEEEDIRL